MPKTKHELEPSTQAAVELVDQIIKDERDQSTDDLLALAREELRVQNAEYGVLQCRRKRSLNFMQVTKENVKSVEKWLSSPYSWPNGDNGIVFKFYPFDLVCEFGNYIVEDGKIKVVTKKDFAELYKVEDDKKVVITLTLTPDPDDPESFSDVVSMVNGYLLNLENRLSSMNRKESETLATQVGLPPEGKE